MKTFLILGMILTSLPSFAFTSVTLKSEAKLVKSGTNNSLRFSATDGKGSDYCTISLTSSDNADLLIIPAGTVFEVTSVLQNNCVRDWGRQCRLDLEAFNQEKGVSLYLMCKDKGVFADKLSESKVNKIAKNKISVK